MRREKVEARLEMSVSLFSSCPDLIRASTTNLLALPVQDVDGRDKPGHDGESKY
jgi:hypothetical protein